MSYIFTGQAHHLTRNHNDFSKLFVYVCQSLSPTLCNPMDCSPQGSSVHVILQARIQSGLPLPSWGNIPHPGIKPRSSALQVDSLPSEPLGKSKLFVFISSNSNCIPTSRRVNLSTKKNKKQPFQEKKVFNYNLGTLGYNPKC